MIIHVKDKLTAAEVRALPVESKVILHGRDRSGYSTALECTIVKSGKTKVLSWWDLDGVHTKPIRDYPNKYYTQRKDV